MIICKETKKGVYSLTFSPMEYGNVDNLQGENEMRTLCRMRLGKCKKHDTEPETLVVIKIPFTKYSLIW